KQRQRQPSSRCAPNADSPTTEYSQQNTGPLKFERPGFVLLLIAIASRVLSISAQKLVPAKLGQYPAVRTDEFLQNRIIRHRRSQRRPKPLQERDQPVGLHVLRRVVSHL